MGLFDRLRKVFGHKKTETKDNETNAANNEKITSATSQSISQVNSKSTINSNASEVESISAVTSANEISSEVSSNAEIIVSAESENINSVTSATVTITSTSNINSEIASEVQLESEANIASEATNELVVDEQQASKTAKELEVHLHDATVAEVDDQKQFVTDITSETQSEVESAAVAASTVSAATSAISEAKTSEAVSQSNVTNESAAELANSSANNLDNTTIKYDEGLKKSRQTFSDKLNAFLANFRSVDEDFFDDLEEVMIEADVGFETTMKLTDTLREEVKLKNAKKRHDVEEVIIEKLVDMYGEEGTDEDNTLHFAKAGEPTVFLFVGVNGAGKTTTIGKLAHRYQQAGKKVLMVAGDTFRAGAIEQLQEWGRKVNVPVVASAAGSDPAAVVFDAVKKAKDEHYDILLVDTAGRLQNKVNLMKELEKIKRIITRELPDAPQEILLVLDATTGQNALVQAKQFKDATNVTGIVLTKLDGTAKGGIVLAIRNELHIPVKLVGLGEHMDDLQDFDPNRFVYGLFKELIVNDDHE